MAFALILKWFSHAERETGWAKGTQMATEWEKAESLEEELEECQRPMAGLEYHVKERGPYSVKLGFY